MGYALFTARKLMLQNRLNQFNYRMMMLQQQRNQVVDQASNMEIMNSMRSTVNNIFAYDQTSKLYDNMLGSGNQTDIQGQMAKLQNDLQTNLLKNQLTAQSDAMKLKSVQAVENQIDMEMKKLETQVKETTAEMESVEKAEENAIKQSSPKYGG